MNFGYKQLYVGGELIDASDGSTFEVKCPADGSTVASLAWASPDDTENALQSAKRGFLTWSSMTHAERAGWIAKLREKIIENREELRSAIMYEMGKRWEETEGDLSSIIDALEYYPTAYHALEPDILTDLDGDHRHHIIHQPVGVVVAYLAYNFPLLNLGFKLGPALAAGCSIIIKPSEYSPLSAYLIGTYCAEIGFPPGVITVLCGELEDVGIPLSVSTIPQLVTMIGSTETAQKLIAQSSTSSIKRYSMECGGNAPFVVFADADLNKAVADAVALKIGNAGQICVAPNRFFVHQSLLGSFTDSLVEEFANVRLGFGKQEDYEMGPLTNAQSVIRMEEIVDLALQQGGVLRCGGSRGKEDGHFFEPTVIVLPQDAPVLQSEVFGPIAMVVGFERFEEVVLAANDTDAGLASYVYSQDEGTLLDMSRQLEFGEVHLNGFKFDIYLPHGGIKNSGFGVDCSERALDDYIIRKRVTQALPV
ncbi:MAG: aldehyde dehydrogenase family protein [Saprospiraceae bacterium]|nr:aldehyde dehydrogenase family protein [Saprospiraceae bacterium]